MTMNSMPLLLGPPATGRDTARPQNSSHAEEPVHPISTTMPATAFETFRIRQCRKLLANWPHNAPPEAAHWTPEYATEVLLKGPAVVPEKEAAQDPNTRRLRDAVMTKRRQAARDFVQMGRAFILMRGTVATEEEFWDRIARRHPRLDREDVELAMRAALEEE